MYTYERPIPVNEQEKEFTGYMVDETANVKFFDHESIYRSPQFNEAMNYFDIDDDMTRYILLSVNEADQNIVMKSLAEKLYKHIIDKVDDIDFGTIPDSKGDITKIDNYEELIDCINIITDILTQYNMSTENIDTISMAVQNIVDRKDEFEKAYRLNIEMPIIIYNTITLSIVSAVSLMIASCIEFIKSPDDNGFNIAVDKVSAAKSKDAVLFKNLKRFNKICGDGSLDKAMDYIFKEFSNNFLGGTFTMGMSSSVVGIGIILLIIPIIRELIFFFYYARSKMSNYFDAQSSLLMINAYNIEHNLTRGDDVAKKKAIAKKQKNIADKFKKISNTLKVETKIGESKSEKEISKLDKEKFKHNEVLDSIPDSSNSILF